MIALALQIKGKVQGVFFRKTAQEKATEFQINGFVKNQDDGSVYMEIEGDEEGVALFLDWCGQGSEQAQVSEVVYDEIEAQNFKSFEIL